MPGVWTQVEQAVYAWVSGALPIGWKAIFAEQQGGAPEGSYVTIRIGDVTATGAVDEQMISSDGLTTTISGMREFPVALQAFAAQGQTTGDNSPRAVLSIVRQALETNNVRSALWAVGLSPFDGRGPVRNVATVAGTIFEPRALFECRFYVVEQTIVTSFPILTVDAGFTNPGPQVPIPGTVTMPDGTIVDYPGGI